MSTAYPQVIYPDEDSPENSVFTVPTINIVDYLKIVIPGYRKDKTVYALFPTSQRIRGGLTSVESIISFAGWRDGVTTSVSPGWDISAQTWDYPGWEACNSTPFGNSPEPVTVIDDAVIAHVGYYPPYPEYTSEHLPDILWKISPIHQYFIQYPNFETMIVDALDRTVTVTTWQIFKQTIWDDIPDIVIIIPIIAALAPPLVLSLMANAGNNTQVNDIRRRFKR